MQARNQATREIVAIKKMSYSGRQSQEVRFNVGCFSVSQTPQEAWLSLMEANSGFHIHIQESRGLRDYSCFILIDYRFSMQKMCKVNNLKIILKKIFIVQATFMADSVYLDFKRLKYNFITIIY